MAYYMTISSRYASWKEFYLSKKKETKGFLKETTEFEDSLANKDPWAFANDSFAFLKMIGFLEPRELGP